jgi:hypothetical protein
LHNVFSCLSVQGSKGELLALLLPLLAQAIAIGYPTVRTAVGHALLHCAKTEPSVFKAALVVLTQVLQC